MSKQIDTDAYVHFIRERLRQLVSESRISEYQLSYDLGHSKNYINNIISGQGLPAMKEFLAICQYFEIAPADFFNLELQKPLLTNETFRKIDTLDGEDTELVLDIISRLVKYEKVCKKE